MIRCVSDVMDRNFLTVKALDGVSYIKDLALEKKISHFPVVEEGKIIGIITYKELMVAHPNRIAADAMTANFLTINFDMPIWEAKYLFEEQNPNLFLVKENHTVAGIITNYILDIEFGKQIDLLTGLYKTDYLYFKALELMKTEIEISVIFIDINNFGTIDKKYGHIYGDKILKEIGLLLDRVKPKGTYLCRFGGDEFVLLTPFSAESAKKAAEDLLNAISSRTYQNDIKVSVSAGISGGRRYNKRTTEVYTTIANLINIASLACTEAKKSDASHIEFGTDIA